MILNPKDCSRRSQIPALLAILIFAACVSVSRGNAAEPSPSADIIMATPLFSRGEQRGYRLSPVSVDEPYEAMGLQLWDILLEVDGQLMVEPRAHLDLFERLDRGESVVATVERAGEIVEVTLHIQLDPIDQFRQSIINELYEAARNDWAAQVLETGLAKSDARAIMQDLASNVADCILDNLSRFADQNSIALVEVVASVGDSVTSIASNSEVFDGLDYENCTYTALQQAGIPDP